MKTRQTKSSRRLHPSCSAAWHRLSDGRLRKIYTNERGSFVKLKLLPVENVRKMARLCGGKVSPTNSKRVWVWLQVPTPSKCPPNNTLTQTHEN